MRSESQETLSVSLITPTYNERENIGLLADDIFQVLDGVDDIDLELIVVDDNSPDGTGEAAEKLKEKYPVQVVHRAGKLGLGSAVMEGFALSERPYLGVMDADMSHDPVVLPQLIHALRDFDLTIGSRFGETSLVEEWAWHRKLVSLVGVAMARMLTGAEDPLTGFFFVRRRSLEGLSLTSSGFKILLEILCKGRCRNHLSVPIVFRNREFSASKLNWREHVLFMKQILYFALRKLAGR